MARSWSGDFVGHVLATIFLNDWLYLSVVRVDLSIVRRFGRCFLRPLYRSSVFFACAVTRRPGGGLRWLMKVRRNGVRIVEIVCSIFRCLDEISERAV